MAHQIAISQVDVGHYYARVGGARYEMRAVRRADRRVVSWDLFRVVDGEEEFLEQAPTLEAHRHTLDGMSGCSCNAPRRPAFPPVPRDVMQWTDLAEAVTLALEQARQIELPVVLRALGAAQRALVSRMGQAPTITRAVPDAEALADPGDALEAEADRLRELAVTLGIARDQAGRVGAGQGTIGCALGVALRAVEHRADQVLDSMIAAEIEDERLVDEPMLEVA